VFLDRSARHTSYLALEAVTSENGPPPYRTHFQTFARERGESAALEILKCEALTKVRVWFGEGDRTGRFPNSFHPASECK